MESAAMRTSNFKLNVRRLIERRLQHSRYFHIIGNYDSVIYSKKKNNLEDIGGEETAFWISIIFVCIIDVSAKCLIK